MSTTSCLSVKNMLIYERHLFSLLPEVFLVLKTKKLLPLCWRTLWLGRLWISVRTLLDRYSFQSWIALAKLQSASCPTIIKKIKFSSTWALYLCLWKKIAFRWRTKLLNLDFLRTFFPKTAKKSYLTSWMKDADAKAETLISQSTTCLMLLVSAIHSKNPSSKLTNLFSYYSDSDLNLKAASLRFWVCSTIKKETIDPFHFFGTRNASSLHAKNNNLWSL